MIFLSSCILISIFIYLYFKNKVKIEQNAENYLEEHKKSQHAKIDQQIQNALTELNQTNQIKNNYENKLKYLYRDYDKIYEKEEQILIPHLQSIIKKRNSELDQEFLKKNIYELNNMLKNNILKKL